MRSAPTGESGGRVGRRVGLAAGTVGVVLAMVLLPVASPGAALGAQTTTDFTWETQGADRTPLEIVDYGRWSTLAQESLSADGAWLAWTVRRLRHDDQLHVHPVGSLPLGAAEGGAPGQTPGRTPGEAPDEGLDAAGPDSTRAQPLGEGWVVDRASSPTFSPDGRWLAFYRVPPVADVERMEREGERVPRRLELLELATGELQGWSDVTAFDFASELPFLMVRKRGGQGGGSDLILRDLDQGTDELLAHVGEASFNGSGTVLAYTLDTDGREGNGLQVAYLESGVRRPLHTHRSEFSRLSWHADGDALAVLRGDTVPGGVFRENHLVVVQGIEVAAQGGAAPRVRMLGPEDLPEGQLVTELTGIDWNEAGDRIVVGLKAQEPKTETLEAGERRPDVHVFHWDDDRIQTVQQRQASADRNRSYPAVVHLDELRLVPMADAEMRQLQMTRDGRWGLGADPRPYQSDWEENRADYYRVDADSGERELIVRELRHARGLSPDSRFFLYWEDGHFHSYELATGERRVLGSELEVSFADPTFDRFGTLPPAPVRGWAQPGDGALVTDGHDLWLLPMDGGEPRNLTGGLGAAEGIAFVPVSLDPDAREVDLSEPVLLRAFSERTKASGFFRLDGERLEELVFEDRWYSTPVRAEGSDRLLFTRESFREFPDLHVAGPWMEGIRRVTDANPQQAEYRWGTRVLFTFELDDGTELQGTLAIPDGYRAGDRLPMLVNFYEQNSHNLHRYQLPMHAHRPNFSGYVSRGYLVMQPDIRFRTRTTHTDMLESVEAAVRRVIDLGFADPDAVGLNGHSFSGGGSAYIAGRSTLFGAIVAGAAPINLRSEFNQLFRGSGQNNHGYDIHGQGRYGTDPYTDLELYLEQSPITHVPTMDTPMIYLHGEDDQVVEYLQGMELYNAARFLGKPLIFLSYPGEGHGLGRLENQLDFQYRIGQFYDHHLKGAPAPGWMTDGVPYLERDEHLVVPRELLRPPGSDDDG